MANVAHATLTGSNLHEPKGITAATTGQVYVANGAGTGVWTDISATSFTGIIADFATPVAPNGWLECDGTNISTITFPALYAAMTIQVTGTRTSGGPIVAVTSGNTTNMRPGYFVYGLVAGQFVSGTTILTVDNPTQFTMSAGASSNGSAVVVVSPWLLNTNTIQLPNTSAAARYRRSRSSTVHMGTSQTAGMINHTHSGTTTTSLGTEGNHTHTTDAPNISLDHSHSLIDQASQVKVAADVNGNVTGIMAVPLTSVTGTLAGGVTLSHTHTVASSGNHGHPFVTGNPSTGGGTETRPITLVLMTCVKT
jgi:microcystin-dependent protein